MIHHGNVENREETSKYSIQTSHHFENIVKLASNENPSLCIDFVVEKP